MSEPTFTESEMRVLASLLDEVIPPSADAGLPGAGELGLAGYVAREACKTPGSRAVIAQGLAALEGLVRARGARDFTALSRPEKLEVTSELSSADAAFFFTVMFHGYASYYGHERVVAALGREPRPPHPKGYEMPPDDLTLLDPVRRRPKLYREC